jgi:UDP-glucose 6-dehydrogenase
MNINVFGLGYIGCVSLECPAQNGHHVIGVDVSKSKVDKINKGESTIVEKEICEIIKAQHADGRIKTTQNFKEVKIKIIFFDDLKYKQNETLTGICNFLEVDNTYSIKEKETVNFQINRKLNNIAYGLLGRKGGRTLINLIPKFVKNPFGKL